MGATHRATGHSWGQVTERPGIGPCAGKTGSSNSDGTKPGRGTEEGNDMPRSHGQSELETEAPGSLQHQVPRAQGPVGLHRLGPRAEDSFL